MPEPAFTQSILAGAPTGNWTSLQFGPDGRLYASQVDGSLYAFTVEAAPDGGYRVASTEAINVVRAITNFNDDGALAAPEVQDAGRLVTGILVVAGGGVATATASMVSTAAAASGEAAPVVVEPRVAAAVPQGSPAGTVAADVDASDPAGTPITYAFTPGLEGGGAWAINPATGVVTVADPSRLDASDPARQVYRLGVDATDAQGDTASTSVLVAVAEAAPPGAEPAPAPVPTAAAAAAPDTPVVLYVSSSDPRFGSQQDVGLDTNSGVVSRLQRDADGGWTRVDLVRGLPSSESDHAVNGMQLIDGGRTLLLGVAGHTNQGAPSYQFAYHSETSYSAAIVAIDLDAVDALPTRTDGFGNAYKYDLPTLPAGPDDPYPDDPFGGRDGLGQAILEPGSPVRIYSPGYRNAYDLVVAESGRLYTVDNGANAGWGFLPENEGGGSVTGRPSDGGFRTDDNLHLVTEGFYGGHPNPIRANPDGAGIYIDGSLSPFEPLPEGWPPVRTGANPVEGDFRNPNRDENGNNEDGSLFGWDSSTNGLAEYRATTFDGEMRGDLLTVSFDRHLYRIELDGAGTGVTAVTRLIADGYGVLGGGIPLDVTAQGDGEPFAGTIWTASYGGEIVAFTPGGDGAPPADGDADDDGLDDAVDAFAVDAANGKNTDLAAGGTLTYAFSQSQTPPGPSGSLFNLGFTGLMANGATPFTGQYDAANITAGGATSGFQIDAVPDGDAFAGNDQQHGFQFGVDVLPGVGAFTVEVRLDNPFGGSPSTAPVNWKSQGFFIGNGDQDNYLKVVAAANGGAGGIEVASESGGAFSSTMYPAAITGGAIGNADTVTLRLAVDLGAGTAAPSWTYTAGGASFDGTGAAVPLSGDTLAALRGTYERAGEPSALAVGLIATSSESGEPFRAFWDSLSINASGGASEPPPSGGGSTTIGTGPDALVLRITQDAYQGDAQYTVAVDGAQIGGTLTAGALRGSGEADTVTVRGDWGPGDHTVSVAFLNDAWGGTADTDRNLYVEGISYNGAALPGATAVFEREGSQSFAFTDTGGGSAPPATTVGTGPDVFDLRVSQDAYAGDAQYTVAVDGAQIGGTLAAQALRAEGASDAVAVRGDWDDSADHRLTVTFLNDAWGGTPDTDRNLYVESASYNGTALGGTPVALYSEGGADFFT
ncbi:hypothetical protein GCM10009416_17790 [Craurococcus roseus]|uniref:Cadherin domain-containing protein n=1 Tax=Craurococcus roseus TaxID=77585 RepID=A0ABN1F1B6_9PROT